MTNCTSIRITLQTRERIIKLADILSHLVFRNRRFMFGFENAISFLIQIRDFISPREIMINPENSQEKISITISMQTHLIIHDCLKQLSRSYTIDDLLNQSIEDFKDFVFTAKLDEIEQKISFIYFDKFSGCLVHF